MKLKSLLLTIILGSFTLFSCQDMNPWKGQRPTVTDLTAGNKIKTQWISQTASALISKPKQAFLTASIYDLLIF